MKASPLAVPACLAFTLLAAEATEYRLSRIAVREGSLASTQPSAPIMVDGRACWYDYAGADTDPTGGGQRVMSQPGGEIFRDTRVLGEEGDFPAGPPLDARAGKLLVAGSYQQSLGSQGFRMHRSLTEFPGPVRRLYPFSPFPDGFNSGETIQIGNACYDSDGSITVDFREVRSFTEIHTGIGRLGGSGLKLMAASGTTRVPGTGQPFTFIGSHCTRNGVTLFYGEGGGKRGIYQIKGSAVSKVIESGDTLPGGAVSSILNSAACSFDTEGGDVAVAIQGSGVFKRVDGAWSKVVAQGDAIPGGEGGFFSVSAPVIRSGRVMFVGARDNLFAPPLQLGIYLEEDGLIEPVVDLSSDFDGMVVRYLTVPQIGGKYWDGTSVAFNVVNEARTIRANYLARPVEKKVPDLAVSQPPGTSLKDDRATRGFGKVRKGGRSEARVFALRNTGKATLRNLEASLRGKGAAHFSITPPDEKSLAPGAETRFRVRFTPTAKGPREATLTIRSNDPDEDPFTVKLTGTGT